jgi:hypothetical protein
MKLKSSAPTRLQTFEAVEEIQAQKKPLFRYLRRRSGLKERYQIGGFDGFECTGSLRSSPAIV